MGDAESAGVAPPVETIEAWQRGEELATRAVFDAYYPRAVRLAVLSGMTPDEAQDCAQNAFVRAFEQRRRLREPQAFSLWFHRIATRSILDTLRLGQRRHEVTLDAAAEAPEDWQRRQAPQPDEQVIAAELRQTLWRHIQTLPPRARVALALRYYDDFSLRDIATMLDMREGTLRVTMHRALAQLRRLAAEMAPAETPAAPRDTTLDTPAVSAPQIGR
jgi:RNA polymerase sigma-70 factor (ECF subfamily)